MAMDANILGEALFTARDIFDNKTHDELIEEYGSDDAIRLACCKADAAAIITHLQTYGTLNVPGTGLFTSDGPVTGESITGTIE